MFYSALEHHTPTRRFSERQIKPAHEFLRQYIVKRQQEGAFRACDPDVTVRAFAGMLMCHLLVTKLFETDTCQAPGESVVENFTRTVSRRRNRTFPPTLTSSGSACASPLEFRCS